MEKDRFKWNRKHEDNPGSGEPSPLIQKYYSMAPGRSALDIACGNGRNSIFLAEKGFKVDAVDISDIALNRIDHPDVNTICKDLDQWSPDPQSYDLIVNIRFLDRRLFPGIIQGLKPGGLLIFESFSGNEDDPYCLKTNELLAVFSGLHIFYYKETKNIPDSHFKATVSLVAVKE